jgi:hypothetical protein
MEFVERDGNAGSSVAWVHKGQYPLETRPAVVVDGHVSVT